jgi:predicted NBD/HSP70 family sugar kinase
MEERAAGSLSSLRELNRLKVLEVVRERHTVSRAEIATSTGLARSTVSTLVSELQRAGLLVEREEPRNNVRSITGRPPLRLSLDPQAGAVIAIQFDHEFVRVAISDLSLTLLAEGVREDDVDSDPLEALGMAHSLIEDLLKQAGVKRDRLLGIGVAMPCPVDANRRVVRSTTILPRWIGLDIAAWLGDRLGVPVTVENDANLGALAESIRGGGRGATEMVYLRISSGVGGGLILGGRLYRGAQGTAGEFGHVTINDAGHMCRCGNRGCLETMVGAGALLELLRRSHGDHITIERMIELARDGDPGCQRVIADAGHTVGRVIAAICNEYNPEMVVVGGELALAGELLLGPIRESIRRYAISDATEELRIVAGELRERAELIGALELVVGQSGRMLSGRLTSSGRG